MGSRSLARAGDLCQAARASGKSLFCSRTSSRFFSASAMRAITHRSYVRAAYPTASSRCLNPLANRGRPRNTFLKIPIRASVPTLLLSLSRKPSSVASWLDSSVTSRGHKPLPISRRSNIVLLTLLASPQSPHTCFTFRFCSSSSRSSAGFAKVESPGLS